MPPISLIELNRSLFHSHPEAKEGEHSNSNNSTHNTNDSWLSCALASHGISNVKTPTSTSAAPHQAQVQAAKKQTIASTAMEDARGTQQSQLLESMVSTLTAKLRTQDAELKQFPEKHDRYVEVSLALETVKDQLECAVHENLQWKRKAKGLEAALALQDIELDGHSSRTWNNVAAPQAADHDNKTNANSTDSKNQEDNVQEHVDELGKLEQERDTAVKQATQLAIQLAESQAAVDDLRDKIIESKAVKEYYQQNNQNNSKSDAQLKHVDDLPPSSNKISFFWPRGGAMFSGTSTPHVKSGGASAEYDEENDDTENLSVSSISQESIVRLQQVHLEQQQEQPQPEPQPSENGSTLEGLDYAPSTSEEHNYV
jgi:hypothetical protein